MFLSQTTILDIYNNYYPVVQLHIKNCYLITLFNKSNVLLLELTQYLSRGVLISFVVES